MPRKQRNKKRANLKIFLANPLFWFGLSLLAALVAAWFQTRLEIRFWKIEMAKQRIRELIRKEVEARLDVIDKLKDKFVACQDSSRIHKEMGDIDGAIGYVGHCRAIIAEIGNQLLKLDDLKDEAENLRKAEAEKEVEADW